MIEQFIQASLPSIEHVHSLAYWLAFVVAFAETTLVVGLLVPGSTLLLLLGALSATGQIDFAGIFWFAVAGAVLGDNLNYWLGKRYGQRWLSAGVWFLKPEYFEQAHVFFDQNGAKSVFLGRFIPSIKEIVPFIAGSVGMHRGTFLFWNLLGGIGWGLQWIGGGYLFGQSLALAQVWISRLGMLLLALLLLWLMLLYLKHILVSQGPQIWLLLRSLYRSISMALAANLFLKQFMRRHPRLMVFLSERFVRNHFSGLPLTLLALTLVYIAILFGGIVEDFLTADPIVAVDHTVAQLMVSFRPPELIPVFTWITALGISRIAGPLLLIALFGTWLAKGRWLAISLLASAGGTAAFTLMGKLAFHRPRPMEAVLLEQSYSFPSGHASIAVGLYGFLGYVLIRSATNLRTRSNYLLLTLLVILSIGLSRIVLGVHYLSDVWAGYLVGAGWLVIGIAISEWASSNRHIDWASTIPRSQRRLLWLLSFAGLAGYLGYTAQWHPRTFTPPAVATQSVEKPLEDIIQEENLSHTETLLGTASQPISAAFVIPNDSALVALLDTAGWQPADSPSPRNLLKLLRLGMAYQNPPLAPVFWNETINDLSFTRTAEVDGKKIIDTLRLWKTLWRVEGAPVYVGVVRSYSDSYWGVLHRIAPNTDAAAQRLLHSLGTIIHSCEVRLGKAEIGNYLLGIPYFSAGKLLLVDIRGQKSSGICKIKGDQQ